MDESPGELIRTGTDPSRAPVEDDQPAVTVSLDRREVAAQRQVSRCDLESDAGGFHRATREPGDGLRGRPEEKSRARRGVYRQPGGQRVDQSTPPRLRQPVEIGSVGGFERCLAPQRLDGAVSEPVEDDEEAPEPRDHAPAAAGIRWDSSRSTAVIDCWTVTSMSSLKMIGTPASSASESRNDWSCQIASKLER